MEETIEQSKQEDLKKIGGQILSRLRTGKKGRKFIAIDGRCASGKTTLGIYLKEQLMADLFHMDDFFLRPEQRTKKRLEEPGGNVDYERFQKEVLLKLQRGEPVCCQRYDCRQQSLEQVPSIHSTGAEYVIVEGAYSLHPLLEPDQYDLRIFLSVSAKEQERRILSRNGAAILPRFLNEWIPKEERYFEVFQIPSLCELSFEIGG